MFFLGHLCLVITTLPLIRYHLHHSILHAHTSEKQALKVIPLNVLILSSVQSGRWLIQHCSYPLEDSLQHSLPRPVRGVRVVDIGQGVEPIRILGVQYLTPDSTSDEKGGSIDFEVAFPYRSRPSTPTMGLKGRSANLHMLVVFYMSGSLDVPACVELTGFLGTVRTRIQLTPNPPFLATGDTDTAWSARGDNGLHTADRICCE